MNKKIFGIRLGTIISFVVCLAVAFLIWLYANYIAMSGDAQAQVAAALLVRG